jgi:hypothetical protein
MAQYEATLTVETPLVGEHDIIIAKEAKIADIAVYQAVTFTYAETVTGTGNVSTSGSSTTLTAATGGSFKKVYPGATITNAAAATAVVASVANDGTTLVLTSAVNWTAQTWTYKNVDSVTPWTSDDAKGLCNGVSIAKYSKTDDGTKRIQIIMGGCYPPNRLSTADIAAGSCGQAVYDKLQGRGLFPTAAAYKEF